MEQRDGNCHKMSQVVVKCRKLSWRLPQIVVTFFFSFPPSPFGFRRCSHGGSTICRHICTFARGGITPLFFQCASPMRWCYAWVLSYRQESSEEEGVSFFIEQGQSILTLEAPERILFISRGTCSDSIAKLLRACFCGVSRNYRAIRDKMGESHRCARVKLSTKGGYRTIFGECLWETDFLPLLVLTRGARHQ